MPQTLFDWAQQNLPQYFGGPGVDGQLPPFTYRYFAATRSYVAVSAADGGIYVLGPEISSNQLRYVLPFGLFRCGITPEACPVLQVGESVVGTVATVGDENWHAVFLVAGQPYAFDLEGKPTGQGTLEDPLLKLLNGAGQRLTSDDDSGFSFNARIACAPSASGWYFLAAGGFEGQSGSYRLSAGASSAAAPDCGRGTGDGSVDWESPFSAEEIVATSASLATGQAQGWAFDIGGGALPVDVLFVSLFGASVDLTPLESLAACASGGAFTSLATFDGRAASWSFTLPPGHYGLCVRNTSGIANEVRLELKKQPTMAGFHYERPRFSPVAQTILPSGRFAQQAATGQEYRTLLEGAKTGGTIYIIPAAETQNFLAGLPFNHYPALTAACGSGGAAAPEPCELTGVEEYGIAYQNNTAIPQSIVIVGRDYVPH
jgi:hypothetical protein